MRRNTQPELDLESLVDMDAVAQPINGEPANKHFLSMNQLTESDIMMYMGEIAAMDEILDHDDPRQRGIDLLPFTVLENIMRQPSTRTGGSNTTAAIKIGGSAELISGMHSSAEAKGESLADSWVALATQSDIIGTRTIENYGPAYAATVIDAAVRPNGLRRRVPVINLGDGRNEHPSQALGDVYTIYKHFQQFRGLRAVIVGDHERYRAFHSDLIAMYAVGMTVVAVESPVAPVPQYLRDIFGEGMTYTSDLDEAVKDAQILIPGRNPDEYNGRNRAARRHSNELAKYYRNWIIDYDRLQTMRDIEMVLHARPRRDELHPSVDDDPRMFDVQQMANMIPTRSAIVAGTQGISIKDAVAAELD